MNLAVTRYQEVCTEIPSDGITGFLLKKSEHVARPGTINHDLVHHSKFDAPSICKSLDFKSRTRLLLPKLVAWESEDFQTIGEIARVEIHQLCIMALRLPSFGCDIYYHSNSALELTEMEFPPINVGGLKIVK